MGSQLITWISSFVLMMFLPRYLGSEDFGQLYLAISLTMILQVVVGFGGYFFISKEAARSHEKAPTLVANSLGLRLILWGVSMLPLVAFCFVVGYSETVKILVIILGFSKLWECCARVLEATFQGFEMMEYPSLGNIAERVFLASVGVMVLLLGADSIVVAIVMASSTLLGTIILLVFSPRVISRLPRIEWKASLTLLKQGLPYFLHAVFSVIYYRIDAVMLSVMTSSVVVGWYGAAYRFFDIVMFLPSILARAVFPVLSKLWGVNEQATHARTTEKSLGVIFMAGIPISVCVFAFSEQIISFFFGLNGFGPSVTVLRIFSVGLLLVYIDIVLGTTLFASDKQRQWTAVALIAVFLNPLLNYYMIPYSQTHFGNGGIGAAIATIVTEFYVLMCAVKLMPKSIFLRSSIEVPMKSIAAGTVMVGSIWVAHMIGLTWILRGAVGVMVYIGILVSLRTLEPEDLSFLRSFFSARNLKNTFIPQREVSP
jgi:O-antigen/teichoic acid export membrane protein